MSTPEDGLEPRGPSRGLLAAVVVVALVVLAGLIVAVSRLTGDDSSSDATAPTPTSAASASVCGLPDGDQEVPQAGPPASWEFVGKIAAPTSKTFGPGRTVDGVKTCFARNPPGVVFASANLAAEIYPRDELTKSALRLRTLPGASQREAVAADLGEPGPPSQIVAFRFDDYTPDRATVTLATQITEGPNRGALGATPMTFQWSKGDWKLDLDQNAESIVLTSLDGFVKWSGVS